MSKSTSQNRRLLKSSMAAAAILLAGCKNPFLPSSDISLAIFQATYQFAGLSNEIVIYQGQIAGMNLNNWSAFSLFQIRNKVAATLTSVNIVYTDYAGNLVTPYKSTGGKTFKTNYRFIPMTSNSALNGAGTAVTIFVVDRLVIDTIIAPAYASDRFMTAVVTFRGEDDNGYDFKLSAKIGIKYYQ